MPCNLLKVNRRFEGTYGLIVAPFHVGFLLGFFFDPEDGGYVLLRNVGRFLVHSMTLCPRRYNSS
jgi:hypothetical protein